MKAPFLIGAAVLAIALGAALALVIRGSEANSILQELIAGNAVPTASDIVVSESDHGPQADGVTLTEDGMKTIYVYGSASDPNGCHDLHDVRVVLYRSDLGPLCTPDESNCYVTSTASFDGCAAFGSPDADFEVGVPVSYVADPTDAGSDHASSTWLANVTVHDNEGLSSDVSDGAFSIDSMLAFDITSDINFGVVRLGQVATPQALTIRNTGNRALATMFTSDGDMTCVDEGVTSTVTEDHIHVVSDAAYASTTRAFSPLPQTGSDVPTGIGDVLPDGTMPPENITQPQEREAVWDNGIGIQANQAKELTERIPKGIGGAGIGTAYLSLKMPASGVQGTCSTIIRFTAVTP